VPPVDLFRKLLWGFLALTATAFIPAPEELTSATVGSFTAGMYDDYRPWHWLMLAACILGAVVSDIILYGAGRLFGDFLDRKGWLDKLAPPAKRDKIHHNLHRYGVWIYVVGRMVPGIRTTLFVTTGTMRLPLVRFVIADTIGAVIGTSLFFLLGYAFGAAIIDLIRAYEERINAHKTIVIIVVISIVGAYLIYRYLRQPITTGDPEEVPLIGHQIATHLPTKEEPEEPCPPAGGAAQDNGEAAAKAAPPVTTSAPEKER
jgi:membrane protein DedA with SNARE-associated domain